MDIPLNPGDVGPLLPQGELPARVNAEFAGETAARARTARRACVILNEAAGTAGKLDEAARQLLESEADIVVAREPGEATRLAREVCERGQRIIAAGGDGTVHEVLNGIAGNFERCELAVLPVGTGNDLARALDIPLTDMAAAIDLALHGTPRQVDVVVAMKNDRAVRYFVNMCYGGFGPRVADVVSAESKARWGLLPYWITLARQALDLAEYQVNLTAGGDRISLQLHGILLANSCFLGGGVPAAPNARLNDGLMDVALVPVQSVWDRFVASVDLLRGQIDESNRVVTFRAADIEIHATPEFAYTMDGEAAPDRPLSFRALPGVLALVGSEGATVFGSGDKKPT